MALAPGLDFVVKRDDWRQGRFVDAGPAPEPGDGQVVFAVDRFAVTANNVSYALAGDMLGYWKFFPAEAGWGRVPVMGYADVVRSGHPEVAEGDRVFGFFPMSRYLVIEAAGVGPTGYADAADHRQDTAPAYRTYTRAATDPLHRPEHEDALMLLRGLFMTSFLVDDFLADNDGFGATTYLVTSASSKTSIALAHQLSTHRRGRVVGLTSPRNVAFVESLGSYTDVVAYADQKSLPSDEPAVLVDMSGDGDVVGGLHQHFGDRLRYSCSVGATHWDAAPRAEKLPGAEPTFFFAPAQLQKRAAEWGPGGFQQRLGDAWSAFRASTEAWLEVVRSAGPEALERVWAEVHEGRARPSQGHVLSLRESA